MKMNKWLIVAYADAEYGLKRQEKMIEAKDYQDALEKAWREYPEYHELAVYPR